jgi:PAS domain S-box-containing protein
MVGRATRRRRFLSVAAAAGALVGIAFVLTDVFVDVNILGGGPLLVSLGRPAEIWMRGAALVLSVLGAVAYGRLVLSKDDEARASQRYRALAENAREDIFVVDSDLTVAYMNTYAAREFGESDPGALVGRSVRDLFPTSDVPRITSDLRQAFAGTEAYSEMEFRFDDRAKWLGTRLVPLPGPGGRIESVLGISRDISGAKREMALTEAKVRIGEIVHARLSVEEILLSVIAEATQAVGVDSALALTCDEGLWTVRAVLGHPEELLGTRLGPAELTSAERATIDRATGLHRGYQWDY